MLSIAKCRDLGYYEREVIDGREDYLSESGASPGRWAGSLAAADGFVGPAEREALAAAFAGFHPTGAKLTEHRRTVSGFDLTLSPSKSVSLVWALGSDSDAAAVEASLYAARAEVERYLEARACRVRRGHAGEVAEPGRGFVGAVFLHHTSRLGDPGIHLHWTVFNVTEGPDGRRTALDARALDAERYTAEAVFQAALRAELAGRLGLVFDEIDRHGVAEVVGISADMRRAFSRRRAEITAEMDRLGLHSGAGARVATLTTRKPKPKGITEAELRAEWRARAADHRFDLSNVVRVPRAVSLAVGDDELAAELTVEHATFDERDVVRAVARAARQGASLDEVLARTGTFLASELAVEVCPGRWSTPEMLELERRVIAIAEGPSRAELRAGEAETAAAVAARTSLSDEQVEMVRRLSLSGRPVELVIGHPGTGKTFTLDAVRDAFESSGHRVLGASLAARAARELQAGSGIASTTAHALTTAIDSGRTRLGAGDVLVIDEAAMVGTRLMAGLTTEAARSGAKVILVGDPKQLPAVEAAGLVSSLSERIEVVTLVENRRQVDPVERAVVAALRGGAVVPAVRRLDDHGRVTIGANADQLRDQLVADWRDQHRSGIDAVMGAVRRADARDLNARAQALLEVEGALGPRVATVDDLAYCVGDRVLGHKNRYDLGIVNGDLGVIVGADDRGLRVRLDAGREVSLPLDYVAEHLGHSYARTVHKTQGLTCDIALLLGDDTLYAELGYTGLTRGRQENRLYVVADPEASDRDGRQLDHVVRALGVSRAETAAVDYLEPPVRS
ncbi:MAG TPA: MobF family relaxase [Acidimicrobiales bacterium]|nr:MobF family relaxase [Acidimicrobiales bacterium]